MKNKFTILGIVMIVVGLGIMAWAFFPSFFAGEAAKNDQKQAVEQLEESWSANLIDTGDIGQRESGETNEKSESLEGVPVGESFAVVKIPAFGDDWAVPAAQGTTAEVLDNIGAGHYEDTEGPGEIGNFVLAGHNAYGGYGAFQRINELKEGDEIIIITPENRYIYKFRSSEIVKPDQSEVLYPVPHEKDAKPTEALLTMTTCWPAWSDEERWIAYSVLDRVESR